MHAADPARSQTTHLLLEGHLGEADLMERLLPLVYEELRAMAHRRIARERGAPTLNTTALVHEAYLRLVDETRVTARGRAYFFGAAARAMRQVLVDYARRRDAAKRGGGQAPLRLDEGHLAADALTADALAVELLDLDRALSRLGTFDPRQVRIVECRFFGGLSVEETAAALDVSARTVKREWALARAWLYDTLHSSGRQG